jgi:hypothetical protein
MKSSTLVSCLTLALMLGVAWSRSEARAGHDQLITVDIPFDFMIERTMFPAGNYMVTPQADRIFYLRAAHGRASARIVTEPIRVPSYPGKVGLIFDEENGHHRLTELWMNSAIGAKVPGSQEAHLQNVSGSRLEVLPTRCIHCQ